MCKETCGLGDGDIVFFWGGFSQRFASWKFARGENRQIRCLKINHIYRCSFDTQSIKKSNFILFPSTKKEQNLIEFSTLCILAFYSFTDILSNSIFVDSIKFRQMDNLSFFSFLYHKLSIFNIFLE